MGGGLPDVIRSIRATDGMLGLYRGFGPSVAGIIVYRAGYFGFYDLGKILMFRRWQRHLRRTQVRASNVRRRCRCLLRVSTRHCAPQDDDAVWGEGEAVHFVIGLCLANHED